MSTLIPQWILPSPPGPEIRARFDWLHPAIVQILYSRGLVDPEEVAEFFGERVRPDDPFRMKGVSQAISRIRWA
ncbi:MAG TPA: hypothetical protein G4N94_10370, partial [Caldilineae bacterium]|nr:hypothetical protein [Caldilineae bacterium]